MIDDAQPPQRRRLTVAALVATIVLLGVACRPAQPRMAFVVPGFAPGLQPAPAAFASPAIGPAPSSSFPGAAWGPSVPSSVPRWQDPVMAAARVRTGDEVEILAGDDKGSTGKVIKIDNKKQMVVVEGVNIRAKHMKPMKEGESGSIVKKEMPIHMSNVAVVAPSESEAPVAALATSGAEYRRSADPVMRIRSRSWIPFMSEADEVAEEVEEVEAKKSSRGGRPKKDVSAYVDADPNVYIAGTVRSVMPYGAFVTLPDGNDGLLHISQISDTFTSNVEDLVKPGDEVQVRVIKVDMDKKQVALSMKDPSAKPPPRQQRGGSGVNKKEILKELAGKYDEKTFVPGTVSSIMDFGAFVKLPEGVEGLVHISQVKDGYLASVADELAVGDEVQVRVASVDQKKGQIKLSMLEWRDPADAEAGDSRRGGGGGGGGLGFGADIEQDRMSAEELEELRVGFDEDTPSWLDVALARAEEKASKKAKGEKFAMLP